MVRQARVAGVGSVWAHADPRQHFALDAVELPHDPGHDQHRHDPQQNQGAAAAAAVAAKVQPGTLTINGNPLSHRLESYPTNITRIVPHIPAGKRSPCPKDGKGIE
jgi:hypothetical protein